MIGERDIEIVETGIRPGEKIHEILVSEEEALRTTERAGHYVIESVLPELQLDDAPRPLQGEYSSAHAVVQGEDLLDLIAQADFVDPAGRGRSRGAVKVMTVVGTRPELIRLSLVFEQLAAAGVDHHLVHTGQNYDPRLSDIFFEELELPRRTPTWASRRRPWAPRSAR